MRKRSDAAGEAPAAQGATDPRRVAVACDKCGQRMSLATLEREGGICFKCVPEHRIVLPFPGEPTPKEETEKIDRILNSQVGEPDPAGLHPSSVKPSAEGNAWRPPSPLEMAATPDTVEARVAAGAAIPAVRTASGLVGTEVSFSELANRLEKHGFEVTIVAMAKWTPEQRQHAAFVTSALDKDLNPKIEEFLMALHKTRLAAEKLMPPVEGKDFNKGIVPIENGGGVQPTTPVEKPARTRKPVETVPLPSASVGAEDTLDVRVETVQATWGGEKFTPVKDSFSTCEVGSFTMTRTVLPGEQRRDVMVALLEDMREVAEAERKRKVTSFINALRDLKREVAGAN